MHICVNTADKGDLYISVDISGSGAFLEFIRDLFLTVVVYTNMGGGLMQLVIRRARRYQVTLRSLSSRRSTVVTLLSRVH
jgi:hypothetical protein